MWRWGAAGRILRVAFPTTNIYLCSSPETFCLGGGREPQCWNKKEKIYLENTQTTRPVSFAPNLQLLVESVWVIRRVISKLFFWFYDLGLIFQLKLSITMKFFLKYMSVNYYKDPVYEQTNFS